MDKDKLKARKLFFLGVALAVIGFNVSDPVIGILLRTGGGFLVGWNLQEAWS